MIIYIVGFLVFDIYQNKNSLKHIKLVSTVLDGIQKYIVRKFDSLTSAWFALRAYFLSVIQLNLRVKAYFRPKMYLADTVFVIFK